MTGPTTSRCRNDKCRLPITWGTSPAGKVTPYDPKPVDPAQAGAFRVLYKTALGGELTNENGDMVALKPLEYQAAIDAGEPLYSSHFQTCKFAGEFSRR